MKKGPLIRYQSALEDQEIQRDEAQQQAIGHLQRLFEVLHEDAADDSIFSPLTDLFSHLLPDTPDSQVRGLYLWGGVGRGKTYMMDLFYESLTFPEKKRLHFHRFMRLVHRRLTAIQGTSNPLRQVASSFAKEARVICFDEFFVSDITDAMILAHLLEELFARNVVLVATSNVEPKNLYRNGLQRRKFLPAIDLIYEHVDVINVDGLKDYRFRALQLAEIYHSPLDEDAERSLQQSFRTIAPDTGKSGVTLDIENRPIQTRRCADGVVWFGFSELCDGPRSQNDYIELARLFQTILISGVPRFDGSLDSQARRFVSLVDELYDRNVKLILSAEVPIADLYGGSQLSFEFQRTASRLQEMQSEEYLAREHRP